jgi:hypothetical protein
MRNPERLDKFYEELKQIHKEKLPDWRFGQLMFNFISETGDPFYWEEDEFIERLGKYINDLMPPPKEDK